MDSVHEGSQDGHFADASSDHEHIEMSVVAVPVTVTQSERSVAFSLADDTELQHLIGEHEQDT